MERSAPTARCGFPTKAGSSCKNLVELAGQPCKVHARAALLERIMAGRAGDDVPVTGDDQS